MTTPFEFEPLWQRVRRAEGHRNTLVDEWNAFLEDEPYGARVHVDADGRGGIEIYRVRIPPTWALYLGEMLYQLRATLDGLIYTTVVIETGQDPPPNEDRLEFPIAADANAFKRVGWKMGPLTNERRRLIELVQPYNAQRMDPDMRFVNESLGILNDWARKDRHRMLHVVGSRAAGRTPILCLPVGVELLSMEVGSEGFFLDDDHEVATFALSGWSEGMEIYANPNVMIDIAVNEPPPPKDDWDIFSRRVDLMVESVKTVVNTLGATFGHDAPQRFQQPPG